MFNRISDVLFLMFSGSLLQISQVLQLTLGRNILNGSISDSRPPLQGPDPPSPDGVSRVVPVVPVLGTAVPAKVQLVGWRIGIESCPWFLARCLE